TDQSREGRADRCVRSRRICRRPSGWGKKHTAEPARGQIAGHGQEQGRSGDPGLPEWRALQPCRGDRQEAGLREGAVPVWWTQGVARRESAGREILKASHMQTVKMYSTASCPYCIRAKQLLKERGV